MIRYKDMKIDGLLEVESRGHLEIKNKFFTGKDQEELLQGCKKRMNPRCMYNYIGSYRVRQGEVYRPGLYMFRMMTKPYIHEGVLYVLPYLGLFLPGENPPEDEGLPSDPVGVIGIGVSGASLRSGEAFTKQFLKTGNIKGYNGWLLDVILLNILTKDEAITLALKESMLPKRYGLPGPTIKEAWDLTPGVYNVRLTSEYDDGRLYLEVTDKLY